MFTTDVVADAAQTDIHRQPLQRRNGVVNVCNDLLGSEGLALVIMRVCHSLAEALVKQVLGVVVVVSVA